MPHAELRDARTLPSLGPEPLARSGRTLHKVIEVAEAPGGWLLKSLVLVDGKPMHFFTRVDRRDDGLLVRLDDHVQVERNDLVFDHLALVARRVLDENPGSTLGKTNLAERIGAAAAHTRPPAERGAGGPVERDEDASVPS